MLKNSRCRSRGRKPLADISNGAKVARATSKKEAHGDGGGTPRDRLLHVRSDLSKLINQIDELVVQASEHKFTIEKNQEIDAFVHVLSDIHSTLKSWGPRFEQTFGSLAVGPGNQLELSLDNKAFSAVDGREKINSNAPSDPELGLIISPSPLVSWRNGACTVERGRQLFLLTPLHESKSVALKFSGSSKCFQGRLNNTKGSCSMIGLATLSNAHRSNFSNLIEKVDLKPAPNKFAVPGTGASDGMTQTNFASLTEISNCKDNFIFGSSPYVKISPLKACFLLDSVSDSVKRDSKSIHKGTPWVARTQRNNASSLTDSSSGGKYSEKCGSDEISMALTSKYPELFGLPTAQNSAARRKEVDETLDWFLSPPKTCVLMESEDEKVALPPSRRDKHPLNSGNNNPKLAGLDATPMWKGLESATANGKNAGEATLKRELWTKFEAVSMSGLRLDRSIFQQIPRNRFLDMLEEVS